MSVLRLQSGGKLVSMSSLASDKLLSAALGGLLVLAPACASTSPNTGPPKEDSGSGADAAITDAVAEPPVSIACEAGVSDAPEITSSTIVSKTLEDFTADCNAAGGTVEIEPHCGGENSCRGMSYDTGTMTLTEHTCRGMNTCAGYSCIICD